ncbi:hypothetical protein C7999DRAFT_34724 [Corynascus novoguineensis]|uniref:DUF1772-domain-containing protein n=1 Tax=Corynascus novoguineensis TaxID=1126955 RepID=A0AAN7CMP7_9PEZI|nr:hypothetical protein C7999DRAFT_34724 [Corynascus novoguineensis]
MSTISLQTAAVISGSFLAGAMMSLSLISVPVFLDTTSQAPQLFRQWARTYHYGHLALPTLSVCTLGLYVLVAFRKRAARRPWLSSLSAGLVTVLMVPFTWVFMVPTNNELFRLEAVSAEDPNVMGLQAATGLVAHWSRLHLARSLFPLAGAALGATTLLE